jgi:hypothetical protein
MNIQQFLDSCPAAIDIDDDFILYWSEPGIGFGEFVFYKDEDGNIHCDSETMSKEFLKKIFARFIDEVIFDDP